VFFVREYTGRRKPAGPLSQGNETSRRVALIAQSTAEPATGVAASWGTTRYSMEEQYAPLAGW
jgi:hypothetical protein